MRNKLVAFAFTILVFGGQAWAGEKSWTGVVSDSHCGTKHSTPSEQATTCVSKCVSNGAEYVLVSGGKIHRVSPQEKFRDYAGKSVTVSGTLSKGTINASSVDATK
jgi:hypothetical protein